MKSKGADWYKEGWTLDVKEMSWVEDTVKQVDFLTQALELTGGESVLDLACGFGRHALELGRRGFRVVGVDLTKAYVEAAGAQAALEGLNTEFIRADIRDVTFEGKFDVVLSMADGAVGYLESEAENLKIFDVVARALKPGGKHFLDVMSADYADAHFPSQQWEAGARGLTLSKFEWDRETRVLLYGQRDFQYGTRLEKPEITRGDSIRLYHPAEIGHIMRERKMRVLKTYSDYSGAPASDAGVQLLVCSQKDP